jgi:amino acid transporter
MKCLPKGSLSHLHPKLNVPVRAIVVQAIFNLCFGLLYLGPDVAFNAYIASCTLFLNLSYAAPVLILLIRGRKFIIENKPDFSLGQGIVGYVINYTSVIFVGVTSIVGKSQSPLQVSREADKRNPYSSSASLPPFQSMHPQ